MDYDSKSQKYYKNVRADMLEFFPPNAKKILDIGCGNGALGAVLKERFGAEVWGIELNRKPALQAEEKLDRVFIGPCEEFIDELPVGEFDAIYCNDVLEHLFDPYDVLERIKWKLSSNGVIISSIPNMRHYKTFKKLVLEKNWEYTESGTMDFTHLRFFTSKSIQKLYKDAGYHILTHKGINRTKSIKPYIYNIPLLFSAMDMFYLQYVTVASRSNKK